jgi:hypothetical protein
MFIFKPKLFLLNPLWNLYSTTHLFPLSYLFLNHYYSDGKWWKVQLQQQWQLWRSEPTLNTWTIVDRPSSTSSDHAANPGANARRQPTIAIYGSKALIKEEKE